MLEKETYMELLHRLDVLLRRLVNLIIGVVELVALEVSCGTTIVSHVHVNYVDRDLRVGRVA